MTVTTAARRPNPADMPQHIAGVAQMIAPAAVPESMPFRALYERGVRGSGMHRNTRLVALTLATHANYQDGHIEDAAQPFLGGLTAETGLYEGQVAVALTTLLTRGWVRRAPGTKREQRYDTARLQLAIPRVILARLLKQ